MAKTQTAGKGRLGRKWDSPEGQNLYFSLYWRFQRPVQALSGLSIAVGLACLDVLDKIQPLPEGVRIKWPNDLEYLGGKFAGILVKIHRNQGVVIGIGMNMDFPFNAIEERKVIDLNRIFKKQMDPDTVLVALTQGLEIALPQFDKHGLAPFIKIWEKYKKDTQEINEKGELISF